MKNLLVAVFLTSTALLLGGCAGTSAIVPTDYRMAQSERLKLQLNTPEGANEEGVSILYDHLTSRLDESGLLARANDAESSTLEVNVTYYTMRHGAARAMVGILAGTDNIQSMVKIKEAFTGKALWEFTVESKNPTAWGTSRGLIENHADKIVDVIKASRR